MDHYIAAIISMVCLTVVGVLCIALTLAQSVKDNIIERVGFFLLCLGCTARVFNLWRDGFIEYNATLLHLGIAAVFVGGTWAQFRKWRRQRHIPGEA